MTVLYLWATLSSVAGVSYVIGWRKGDAHGYQQAVRDNRKQHSYQWFDEYAEKHGPNAYDIYNPPHGEKDHVCDHRCRPGKR